MNPANPTLLILCGSYTPHASNRRVLDAFCEHLDCREVWSEPLHELPILRANRLSQPPDPVLELRRSLADADAVVIAGPEYGGGLAGGLKNALDWCVGAEDGFYGKPVTAMSVSASGGKNALQQLAQTLLWQGAHLVSAAAFPTSVVPAGEAWREPVREQIEAAASALAMWMGRPDQERAARTAGIADSVGVPVYPHRPPGS